MLYELSKEIHALSTKKGWWNDSNIPEKAMMIVSEISEFIDEYRNGKLMHYIDINGKPCGTGIELADAIIRILDLCAHMRIDIDEMIKIKHEFNKGRDYRHGGKLC